METLITYDNLARFKDDLMQNLPAGSLSGLTDTTISSAQNGQALVYDSTSSKWINDDINVDLAESITYSNLVSLISANSGAGSLVPGKLYRITDYVTTTVQTDTQSANHPFDLVVMATSPNTLDCQAKAVLHAGDTYFSNANLNKWQVWYDINNDTTKYDWADSTNGKGVIYRFIDEWGNYCPYDFKNIQFKRMLTDGALDTTSGTDTWVYTFNAWNEDDSVIEDASLITNSVVIEDSSNSCYNNVIGVYRQLYNGVVPPVALNDIVFLNTYSIENGSYFECSSNTFGNNCYSNTFGNYCNSNTFGNECYSNTFGNYCISNTFGNYCISNTFGNSCNTNTFGNDCNSNTFWNDCNSNTFGNDCYSNTFGNDCYSNTFGDRCYSNTFGNNCTSNTFGDYCISNTFGNYCISNTFGNYCYSNTFGDYCYSNTFGDGCNNIIFGNSSNQGGTYCSYNIIENGNQYIRLYQTAGTAGDNNQLQNIYIAQGVNKTTTWLDISTIARNLSYRTTVGRESDGTLRIYNEDDKTALSGLSDVNIASAANGQILQYNSTSSKWENGDMNLKFDVYE